MVLYEGSSAFGCKAATESAYSPSPDDAGAFLFDTGLITTIQIYLLARSLKSLLLSHAVFSGFNILLTPAS